MSKSKLPTDPVQATPRRSRRPRNHRELGQAILAEVNPVTVACGLLQSESESVKARTLETVADWAFGSPAAGTNATAERVRIVWNLPRPAREEAAWAESAKS